MTDDEIIDRWVFIAKLIWILSGSFNEPGVRQWFARPGKIYLKGRAPIDILSGDWSPDDPEVVNLMKWAEGLNV